MNQAQYARYLESPDWSLKRKQAIQRAKHRCQICNSPRQLEVHHRDYSEVGNEDLRDLTVLCNRCHELVSQAPWVPGGEVASSQTHAKRRRPATKARSGHYFF